MSRKQIITLIGTLFLAAGTLSPAHAQRSFNLGNIVDAVQGVVQSQKVGSMSDEEEVAIGRDVAGRTLSVYPAVHDERLQRYINRVGLWVALQSPKPHLPWRFAAVNSSQINAFAVPGGTVLVTTGMLRLVSNEAELACVIAHEVGHITRRHHLNLMEKELLINAGTKVATSTLQNDMKGQLGQALAGEGAQLFNRSLDRGAEAEADGDGVLYAARAGYDPNACLLLMQRMASLKAEAGTLESLYKTHPSGKERAESVSKALQQLAGSEPGAGARPQLEFAK